MPLRSFNSGCHNISCSGDRPSQCADYDREYLKGYSDEIPGFLASSLLGVMVEQSEWSAFYDSGNFRWRVFAVRPYQSDPSYLNFHVYEKTGLVEGAARKLEEIVEDLKRYVGSQR